MTVAGIDSSLPTYEPPAQFQPVGKKELDRSDFMHLFITQLQFQDPTKPMDSYEVASQLAQFSTLEATLKMSTSMDNLLDYQKSQNHLQLLNLLGSQVEATGNRLVVADGATPATHFVLDGPAEKVTVNIIDPAGRLVRQLDLGALGKGVQELAWDGEDGIGRTVADGVYTYQIDAIDALGDPVAVDSRTTGTVTGLEFGEDGASLTLDDAVAVTAASIVNVRRPPGTGQ